MNKTLYTHIVIVTLLLGSAITLSAQTTHLPFFEGFETEASNSAWTLNAGPRGSSLTNRWCVSAYEPYMGDSCLIISNNAATPTYTGTTTNSAVAYIDFLLPSGKYYLSFSWRCVGEQTKDGLYVVWLPQYTVINSSVAAMSPHVVPNAIEWGDKKNKMLYGRRTWQSAETTIEIPGNSTTPQPYRLNFVWANDGAVTSDMAVCIDNVQLSAVGCGKPADIQCTLDQGAAELTWDGDATASYQIMYRPYGRATTDTVPGTVSGTNTRIPAITEGVYDLFIRTICPSGDTTVWSLLPNKLVYSLGDHCIDFVNFKAPGTKFTTGTYKDPYETSGAPKDHGYDDWRNSRHTIHYIPGETDPYTGGQLKTVGPHAAASLRIGNSEGAEAESVSYSYTLQPDENIIMLVDYAIVYESPNHTTESEQPNITIDILDENDKLINPDGLRCNEVYFYPPLGGSTLSDTTWHVYDGKLIGRQELILWRDWHTMGINLSPLVAGSTTSRTVKIRLTVRDCSYSQHFAHAFFAIRCTSASLEGYSCGDTTSFGVSAPPGFTYRWYNPSNPDKTLSTERYFEVDDSQADTFRCDVFFADKSQCSFPLEAYLVPRLPVAAFDSKHSPRDCRNRLVLTNTGGIMSDGALTGEPCEYTEWTITDLSTGQETVITDSINPELYFPDWGDTISVRLLSGISDNKCTDIEEKEWIIVPPIITKDTVIVRNVCQLPYKFGSITCDTVGRYVVDEITEGGCNAKVILDVRQILRQDVEWFDTICQGDSFEFFEHILVEPTPAEGFLKTLKTADGKCDSIVYTLHLHVRPRVELRFDSLPEICVGAPHFDVPYRLLQGDVSFFSLRFVQKSLDAGFLDVARAEVTDEYIRIPLPSDTLRPDRYLVNVVCHTDSCGVFIFDLPFTVCYPTAGIMEQKWNDAIALLNRDHNYGGFEYSAYQWYRNGAPIPGATSSYLYIGSGGDRFATADEYRVELTRAGESYGILSCPFIPVESTDASEHIVILQPQGARTLSLDPAPSESGTARWYTPSGIFCGECPVSPSSATIPLPSSLSSSSIYILHITFPSRTLTFKVLIP